MLFDDQNHPIDFVYLAVNDAFRRLTGLDNVVGKMATEAIPDGELHPELFEIYGRVALTGQPEQFEIEFKPLSLWLSIAVYSTESGYFTAIFENITERKRFEDKLAHVASFPSLTPTPSLRSMKWAQSHIVIPRQTSYSRTCI